MDARKGVVRQWTRMERGATGGGGPEARRNRSDTGFGPDMLPACAGGTA